MKINKRGQSTNLVLIVGIILATSISVFAVYSTFDDIVRDMVMGDPDVAAREIASYIDIAAASPNEITIYTQTPMTVAGFPAYGTILLNAEDQEIRVHPYMQNLMQSQILKSIYGEISAEEAAALAAIYDMRNSEVILNAQRGLAEGVAEEILEDSADGLVQEVDSAGNTRYRAKKGGCCGGKYKGGQFVSHVDVDDIVAPKRKAGKGLGGYRDIVKKKSTKIADRKIAKSAAASAAKSEGVGFVGKNWKRMKRVASIIRPANIVDFFGKHISAASSAVWNKNVVKRMRGVTVKAAKKIGARLSTWTALTSAFAATKLAEKFDPTGITPVTRRVAYGLLATGEGLLTFYPIHRSIVNSQDATQQIEDKFGTFEFHTGNTEIHVAKPNCYSERYAVDADLEIPYIGWIGLDEILGRQFNMPMSRTLDNAPPREYSKITNDGDECYDAHNVYLNQDGEVIRNKFGDIIGDHPYAATIGIPFATCVVLGIVEPSYGSGCIMGMESAILGAWANSDSFISQTVSGDIFEGDITTGEPKEGNVAQQAVGIISPYESWSANLFMVGVAALIYKWIKTVTPSEKNARKSAAAAMLPLLIYTNFPADSSTLFSYISDSGRLIDSEKEYYMNDPLLISISKKYDEDKDKYVLVIDKEI
jgi:hypothetical protein